MAQRHAPRPMLIVWVVLAVVGVALLLILALPWVTSQEAPGGAGGTETDPTSTPSASVPSDEELEADMEGHDYDRYDCLKIMSEAEYASFIERFIEFETIYHTQLSEERLRQMEPYATDTYLATQEGFREDNYVEGAGIVVDPTSTIGCLSETPGVIIARIVPTVDVTAKNDDGTDRIVHDNLVLAPHFTQWEEVGGVWLVVQ